MLHTEPGPRTGGQAHGMDSQRYLIVVADDYGIGPATSRAILELAAGGRVTGAVLLVNAPFAEDAVRNWRRAGTPMELGWHPCLTLDRPILPARRVPSLVGPDGRFWPLAQFLRRWALGRLRATEIAVEFRAQYARFVELVGQPPSLVNSHQHVELFPPIGDVLLSLLRGRRVRPYLRRVVEPWPLLARVPGARLKRTCLNILGRWHAQQQRAAGFPGNDTLAGITDPPWVENARFLTHWLTHVPGRVVELMCHPGHHDDTLIGRDCAADDGYLRRRVRERELLGLASFEQACQAAGFVRVAPAELVRQLARGPGQAA